MQCELCFPNIKWIWKEFLVLEATQTCQSCHDYPSHQQSCGAQTSDHRVDFHCTVCLVLNHPGSRGAHHDDNHLCKSVSVQVIEMKPLLNRPLVSSQGRQHSSTAPHEHWVRTKRKQTRQPEIMGHWLHNLLGTYYVLGRNIQSLEWFQSEMITCLVRTMCYVGTFNL